jgi:MFS superfamily sulfate permease-like transporter
MTNSKSDFKFSLATEFSAGLVVFLVALPLCLGIALASGAPLFSGIIAGVLGGLVVAPLSGSPVSVSGPAAGLAVIVAQSIESLGSFELFSTAVLICGILQCVFRIFKLGRIGEFFPTSVIKGMLAGIGIIIALKQIPHALGKDLAYNDDVAFFQILDGENTISEIWIALNSFSIGALIISTISILLLLLWETKKFKKSKFAKIIPAPLVVVAIGTIINEIMLATNSSYALIPGSDNIVNIPLSGSIFSLLTLPNFSGFNSLSVYTIGLTLAIVASLETLLSVEATDKLDPLKRISNTNQELFAQGVGNITSGLIGGLPITAVVVRSSANIYAGGKTKISAVVHSILLLACVALIPQFLNKIPLSTLAAVLIMVGYKLAHPSLFIDMWNRGKSHFVPFIVTVLCLIFTDLLIGVAVGFCIGIYYVVLQNKHHPVTLVSDGNTWLLRINKDLSFIHKAEIKEHLISIPRESAVTIDGVRAMYIDHDILDLFRDFRESATLKGIKVDFNHIRQLEN